MQKYRPSFTIDSVEPDQFTRISRALADPRRMSLLERAAAEDEVACATDTGEPAKKLSQDSYKSTAV